MKTLIRLLRWAAARRGRLALVFAFTIPLVLLAHPAALAADVYGNIGPAPQLPPGGWSGATRSNLLAGSVLLGDHGRVHQRR